MKDLGSKVLRLFKGQYGGPEQLFPPAWTFCYVDSIDDMLAGD